LANPASKISDALQSVADFASVMWQASRAWLTKDVADLRENFVGSFRGSIADVFEQMLYFLAFATDSALSTAFKWHC
jgi:hypothetical protein